MEAHQLDQLSEARAEFAQFAGYMGMGKQGGQQGASAAKWAKGEAKGEPKQEPDFSEQRARSSLIDDTEPGGSDGPREKAAARRSREREADTQRRAKNGLRRGPRSQLEPSGWVPKLAKPQRRSRQREGEGGAAGRLRRGVAGRGTHDLHADGSHEKISSRLLQSCSKRQRSGTGRRRPTPQRSHSPCATCDCSVSSQPC